VSRRCPFLGTATSTVTDLNFRVAPNPARDEFMITALVPLTAAQSIALVDALGRTVFTTSGRGDRRLVIPCGSLEAGAYVLRISGPEGISVVKVVLER